MVITVNGSPITLDLDTILIWILVGFVAGFLASHLALGHGLGLLGDIVIGVIGAFIGGFVLAGILHFTIGIAGHPIVTQMIMAFIGAAILLIIVRLLGGGRSGYRRRAF
ncbi:MAG TPA: GlsB/YeaQ/YmgE family stress response membrane protein [Candidatus Dormibacteraeota bacterium]|nr:GlsB/YeaQ/YmgE family stress response membrane protein [Candidatus Dormibacteraeota bacterium]